MKAGLKTFTRPLVAAALGAALLPGMALAHGDVGAHIKTYWQHMDEYQQGVARVDKALEGLVQEARNGAFDASDVEGLIAVWEDVKVHAAIEVVAIPLYGPVWGGISALRSAADEKAPAEQVAAAARQTSVALHQGLGALKFAAYRHENPQAPVESIDDDPIHAIEERLQHALEEYAEGHRDGAKELIRDAYLNHFEGIEGTLIERDVKLVTSLEEDFNGTLPNLITEGAAIDKVRKQVEDMLKKLHTAETLLVKAESEKATVF